MASHRLTPSIYFFPWVDVQRPLSHGRIVLEPYVRREAPDDQRSVSQSDIDARMVTNLV
jgi:hypothetical protein